MTPKKYFDRLQESFHRVVGPHNTGEKELVRETKVLIGGEARVLAGGLRIQAFNGTAPSDVSAYTFRTKVKPKCSLGFVGAKELIREVYWDSETVGVTVSDDGKTISIPVEIVES